MIKAKTLIYFRLILDALAVVGLISLIIGREDTMVSMSLVCFFSIPFLWLLSRKVVSQSDLDVSIQGFLLFSNVFLFLVWFLSLYIVAWIFIFIFDPPALGPGD